MLGSGCRRSVQNQMSAASAGMSARPLSCPLTLDAALCGCISVWRCLPVPHKPAQSPLQSRAAQGAGRQQSHALVNNPPAANFALGWPSGSSVTGESVIMFIGGVCGCVRKHPIGPDAALCYQSIQTSGSSHTRQPVSAE